MSSREFVMVVEESAYKTPVSTPVTWNTGTSYGLANAQAYCPRLDGDNAMTMRPRPVMVQTMYGGGIAVPAAQTSDKIACTGQLRMKLSLLQTPFWLSWAGVQINTAQTAPWTTTLLPGNLASCSLYHGVMRADGTIKRRVYLGTQVTGWTLTVSEASTVCTLVLDLVASTPQGNAFDSSTDPTSGVFPVPPDNTLPTDWHTFINLGGASFVTFGGAVRTQFTEMTITSRNVLSQWFYANRFLNTSEMFGRTTTIASRNAYPPSSQDDRTHYEGTTSESVSVEMNNGTHGFTLTANAQNVFTTFEDDLSMPARYFQSATSINQWDASVGSDFTLTFA
jgi:hypothetical protein